MDRRDVLKLAAAAGADWVSSHGLAAAVPGAMRMLDARIHLFDPERPGDVPWPEPSDPVIYQLWRHDEVLLC